MYTYKTCFAILFNNFTSAVYTAGIKHIFCKLIHLSSQSMHLFQVYVIIQFCNKCILTKPAGLQLSFLIPFTLPPGMYIHWNLKIKLMFNGNLHIQYKMTTNNQSRSDFFYNRSYINFQNSHSFKKKNFNALTLNKMQKLYTYSL